MKPWWKRLSGQPPTPRWWNNSLLTRLGFIGTVIFGMSFLLRVAFPDRLGGLTWLWGVVAGGSVVTLVLGIRKGPDSGVDAP